MPAYTGPSSGVVRYSSPCSCIEVPGARIVTALTSSITITIPTTAETITPVKSVVVAYITVICDTATTTTVTEPVMTISTVTTVTTMSESPPQPT